jgi:hypothetical protein
MRAACSTHPISIDFITIKIMCGEPVLCNFLHPPITTLFIRSKHIHTPLNVFFPYGERQTAGKIVVLYILLLRYLDTRQKDERF